MKLRVLSMFSGIGGFELGLDRTGGFETVQQIELKPHARAVLAKNFPGVPCHDDVTTYEFRRGEADVITAGFPCQDLSFAGSGAGLAGARSGLYREVVRAVRMVRPLYAILENVAALLSRGLGAVLGDLAEIGYDAEWHCIPASAVGAPHRRDRIWIVADPSDGGHRSDNGSGKDTSQALEACSEGNKRERLRNVSGGSRPPLSGWLSQLIHEAALANAPRERRAEEGKLRHGQSEEWFAGSGEALADAERIGQQGQGKPVISCNPTALGQGEAGDVVDGGFGGQWAVEPGLGRVAHGVPNRVDRLEELGNAIVPQIPEAIGNAILESRRAAA